MRFALDIDYAPEKMQRSRARMDARTRFQYADRVPIGFCLAPRYFTPIFGIPYRVFFKDPETQYYWQLQFVKCLEALAPCGGFMLGAGANVCPGTPVEHLAGFSEAAEEYGMPQGQPKKRQTITV